MRQKMNTSLMKLNWRLLISVFLVLTPILGWFRCRLAMDFGIYYNNLFFEWSIISAVLSSWILHSLRGDITERAHLWVIYITYLIGHYIQFYTLIYWYFTNNNNFYLILARVNYSFNITPESMLKIYTVSTIGLLGLAIAFFIIRIRLFSKFSNNNSVLSKRKYLNSIKTDLPEVISQRTNIAVRKSLVNYAIIVAIIGFTLLLLTIFLNIGARVDAATGLGRIRLPFKLVGIITYSNKLLIPSISLMLIYLSDMFRVRKAIQISCTFYFLHSLIYSIISTGRSPILVALFSFATISAFSKKLSRSRVVFLVSAFFSLPLFFGIVTTLRFMREVGEVGSIFKVNEALSVLFSNEQLIDTKYLFFLVTRLNGAGTLVNVENIRAKFGSDYILNLLIENNFDFASVFTKQILQNTSFGFGASPGLTGALSMISNNLFVICCGVILHVILWNFIFKWFSRMNLKAKPMALAQVSILAGFYTSAGTFDKIPLHSALIICIIFICERMLDFFIGKPKKHLSLIDT